MATDVQLEKQRQRPRQRVPIERAFSFPIHFLNIYERNEPLDRSKLSVFSLKFLESHVKKFKVFDVLRDKEAQFGFKTFSPCHRGGGFSSGGVPIDYSGRFAVLFVFF